MKRLDVHLTETRADFSRSVYQKFIRECGVMVNGRRTNKPHAVIRDIDRVQVSESQLRGFVDKKEDVVKIEQKDTPPLHEGKGFFVIDKPPFVTTERILTGFLPVHRLDKDTSGILVCAKNMKTQAQLQKQWQERTVKKTYLAVIKGVLTPAHGSIEGSIRRSMLDRRRMAISRASSARGAVTDYEVISHKKVEALGESLSLIRAFPKTGRTHQIRIHFASIGHPVIGDSVYGDGKLNKKIEQIYGLKRQFLHAAELELIDPETKKKRVLTSKLPADLVEALRQMEIRFTR